MTAHSSTAARAALGVIVVVAACSTDDSGTPVVEKGDASVEAGRGTLGGAGGSSPREAGNGGSSPREAGNDARDAGPVVEASALRDASAEADASLDAPRDSGTRSRYRWQLSYDRSYAAHVAVDTGGAAIVSGTFFDTKPITLGATTLTSVGGPDIMLSRVLPNGAVDWARSYGAAADDYPVSFVLDSTNRIALTGLYNGAGNLGGPDFPTFAGTPGRFDAFVAGLSASGDYRWQSSINTTAESFPGPGVALNAPSGVFVAGHFLGTATIGGQAHASAGSWDVYFARFDEPNGTVGAVLTFGGAEDDRAIAAVRTSSDVVVFGTFHGQVTFPTTPPKSLVSAGGADIFIARISPAGAMASVVAFGGPGDEIVQGARLDADGSIVVAGDFSSPTLSVLGGRALTNSGGIDLFVARLTPALSHAWSVSFGGDADDHVRDIALGSNGDIAITGEFRNSISFASDRHDAVRAADSGPTEIDVFLAKLSSDGTPVWSVAAGGGAPDRGLGVALDSSSVYLTATFQSPIDFGGGEVLTPEPSQWASALVKYAP